MRLTLIIIDEVFYFFIFKFIFTELLYINISPKRKGQEKGKKTAKKTIFYELLTVLQCFWRLFNKI